jgi:hypothetical protein
VLFLYRIAGRGAFHILARLLEAHLPRDPVRE